MLGAETAAHVVSMLVLWRVKVYCSLGQANEGFRSWEFGIWFSVKASHIPKP